MNRKGSLLIITLWMVTILSVFSIAIARYLSVELRVMRYRAARAQAETMARSGVYAAMRRISVDGTHGDEAYDWLGDLDWAVVQADNLDASAFWELRAAGASIADDGSLESGSRLRVNISDEAGKLNIAQAPALPAVAAAIGSLLNSDELAARLIDYMDADTALYVAAGGASGLEADESANPPYIAKNAMPVRCEELLAIPGFSALQAAEFRSFCALSSLHLGDRAMNINTLDTRILTALGLSGSTVGIIDQFRRGPDGDASYEQDGKFEQAGQPIVEQLVTDLNWTIADPAQFAKEQGVLAGMGIGSQAFQVDSTGESRLRIGKKAVTVSARVLAVVRRKDCGQNMPDPCILSWSEW